MRQGTLCISFCLGLLGCDFRPLPAAGLSGPQGPQGPAGAPGQMGAAATGSRLPAGVWLDATNSVAFGLTEEGLSITNRDTSGYANPAGGFDDAACATAGSRGGNKGLVSLSAYSGKPVSELGPIEVTVRQDRGQPHFYLNLIVDCDGDGDFDGADAIVVADSLTQPALALGRSFATVAVDPALPQWKSVGGRCGLPSHDGSVGAALSSLPSGARLLNAQTKDCGMPRGAELGSILLIQGDSLDRQFHHLTLQEVAVTLGGQKATIKF